MIVRCQLAFDHSSGGTVKRIRVVRPTGVAILLALSLVGLVAAPASADYSPSATPGWGTNNTVFAMDVQGDRVYIAGAFNRVINPDTGETVPRLRVAAFDAVTGDLITSFQPAVDGVVRAIDVAADGTVYLGGSFQTVNGQSQSRLAAVDPNGELIAGWSPSITKGTVRDLALFDNSLFVAGTFPTVNGSTRGGLAKLVASTGALTTWKAVPKGGKAWTITPAPSGNDLVIGGAFTTVKGLARPSLAAVDMATAVVTPWAPTSVCDGCELYDLVVEGDAVYGAVGGPGGRAVRWSLTTGQLLWSIRGDGNVQAIDVSDGVVYAGGHFGPSFGGQIRGQLAAVDASTGTLLPWTVDLGTTYYPGIWAIDAGPDFLRIGGGFKSVTGARPARFAALPAI